MPHLNLPPKIYRQFNFRKQKQNRCNIKNINKILNGLKIKEKTAAFFFNIQKAYNKQYQQKENIQTTRENGNMRMDFIRELICNRWI